MKIYVILCLNDIFGNEYFTDEDVVAKRVESIREVTGSTDFWYMTLNKSQT